MKEFIRRKTENDSFPRIVMAVILIIFIVTISAFSILSFNRVHDSLTSHYQFSQQQSEEGLATSLVLVDKGLELFDSLPDAQMKTVLEELSREYEAAERNPDNIDYNALKARFRGSFDGDIEFYVINETGIIEYSTFEDDIGVDFKRWPEYYAMFTDVRLGNEFSPDRSAFGVQGILRKFAYLPMPDHRYVVQMSLQSPEFHEIREKFSYQMALQQCMDLNPDIIEIRLFDRMPRYRCNATSGFFPADYVPGADVLAMVNQAFTTEMQQEISVPATETLIRYIYLDMPDGRYLSSPHMDLVAEITYSTHALHHEVAQQLLYHVIIALVAIMLGGVVAFGASLYVSRPVTMLAEDVAVISNGDLDHTIRKPWNSDIRKLSQNIAFLVARLKDNLIKVQRYSNHLEQIINDRTERLQETNTELNRYLDLLKYTVRNASNEIQSYLNLQKSILSDTDTSLIDAALATARRTERTVATIYTLRRALMFGETPHVQPIDLSEVIGGAIHDHHAIVRYRGENMMVCADELLGLAVFNLIQFCTRVHDQGDITIATDKNERSAEVRITFSSQEPMLPLQIDIRDPGIFRHPELEIAQLILRRYGSNLNIYPGDDTRSLLVIAFRLKIAP